MNNLLAHKDNTPMSKLRCAEKFQGVNVASCKDCCYPWYRGQRYRAGRCPWYRAQRYWPVAVRGTGSKDIGWPLSVVQGSIDTGLVAVHGVGEQRRRGYSLSLIKGRMRRVTPHFSAISRHFAIFSSPMISTTENQVKIPRDAHFLAKSCRPSKADLP